jgi:hypothetical protein
MVTESELTLPTGSEDLGPLVERTRECYRSYHGYSLQLMLNLDSLQRREAHKPKASFSAWAQERVGIPASTARGLVRMGRCLAILVESDRVDPADPQGCPSQAALRGLARVRSRRKDLPTCDEDMLQVFDAVMASRGKVTEEAVSDAYHDMFGGHKPRPDANVSRENGLYPLWDAESDADEDGDVADRFGYLAEDLDRLRQLARRRDRQRFRAAFHEVEIELGQLRELVEQGFAEVES